MKAYITDHVFKNLDPEKRILGEVGAEVVELHCADAARLQALAPDADVLLTTYLPGISDAVMAALPNLKGIVRYGIGVDTIDLAAAKARGIQVANVPDYCIDEVSDHAVAMVLALVRKLVVSSNRIKAGDYGLHYVHPVKALRASRATVFGFGRIGRRIADKLRPFGCEIQFYDPYVESAPDARKVDLEEALETSDIIVLQSPSTPQTHHILNADAFGKMKRRPYIINTARGDLIDTLALERALEEDRIAGAGLDVVEGFGALAADFCLNRFENVILTPHSAWVSQDALVQLQTLAAQEAARILRGEAVRSSVLGGL